MRAYFRVEYEGAGENRRAKSIVRCSSDDSAALQADTRGDVDLIRQHNVAPCQEGAGIDERASGGPRMPGGFVAQPHDRPENPGGYGTGRSPPFWIMGGKLLPVVRGGVQLVKQRSRNGLWKVILGSG
jgi:hypothetical protein